MTVTTLKPGGSFLAETIGPDDIFTRQDISEEQQLFALAAGRFMREEVVPVAEQLYAKDWSVTRKLMRQAGELDLLRADIPEPYGGLGLDKISAALVSEQMALNASFAATVSAHTGIGALPIVYFGTPEQRSRYLPRLAGGELISAFCLTEPGSGSDALAAKTRASLSPDGRHYILNGQKMWITNGGLAGLFIVFAKVDGEKFTAFIVERGPGVISGHEEKKLGLDGSSTTAVTFEDCRVPVENLLGEVGRGHVVAFNTLNFGRLKLGHRNIGLAKIALHQALLYSLERRQFGRPIAGFGLIKKKLAEMAVRCYAGDAITFRTVGQVDAALESTEKAEPLRIMKVIEQFAVECSIVKVWTSEALGWIADEALQTFGGYGYSKDYPAERIVRDARITRIYEGTNEINRLVIATRSLKAAAEAGPRMDDALHQALQAGRQKSGAGDGGNGHGSSSQGPSDHRPSGGHRPAVEHRVAEVKATAILALQAIARGFGEDIKEKQEALAMAADILIEAYTMESVWLRTAKLIARRGEEAARIPLALAALYAGDAAERAATHARNLAGALAGASAPGKDLGLPLREAALRLAMMAPLDAVTLRQSVADALVAARQYSW